ncbi:MAG: hypothetical protein WBO17_09920 [Sphingorhabdus sp.]
MLIFALALTTPTAFSDIHQRDIACVASLAIIADEQRRGVPGPENIPDVRETGKRWAAIVGERVMQETGQPRELVAFAMTEAAKSEQLRSADISNSPAINNARVTECLLLMQTDLLASDPLPKPVRTK